MFNFSLYRRKKNKAYAALALDSSQQASTASKHLGIKTDVYSCEVLLLLHAPIILASKHCLFWKKIWPLEISSEYTHY